MNKTRAHVWVVVGSTFDQLPRYLQHVMVFHAFLAQIVTSLLNYTIAVDESPLWGKNQQLNNR